jgi:hypothetical protein
VDGGFGVPDFLDSLVAFQPQQHRVDGLRHLVVFPMYTQNGSTDRHVEALLVEVIWPRVRRALEAGDYGNRLFLPLRLLDFTRATTPTARCSSRRRWRCGRPRRSPGARSSRTARPRASAVSSARPAEITDLDLPEGAARMLADQELTEKAFVVWDLIHDRTHMRGDLPFDPFMIKQRMPYFLYSLEELRCDLTAFRECVWLEQQLAARRRPARGVTRTLTPPRRRPSSTRGSSSTP